MRAMSDETSYTYLDSADYDAALTGFREQAIDAVDLCHLEKGGLDLGITLRIPTGAAPAFDAAYHAATEAGDEINFEAEWATMLHRAYDVERPDRWKLIVRWSNPDPEEIGITVPLGVPHALDALEEAIAAERIMLQLEPPPDPVNAVIVLPRRGDLLGALAEIRARRAALN